MYRIRERRKVRVSCPGKREMRNKRKRRQTVNEKTKGVSFRGKKEGGSYLSWKGRNGE